MATFTTPDGRTLNVVGSIVQEGQRITNQSGKQVSKGQLDRSISVAGRKGENRYNY